MSNVSSLGLLRAWRGVRVPSSVRICIPYRPGCIEIGSSDSLLHECSLPLAKVPRALHDLPPRCLSGEVPDLGFSRRLLRSCSGEAMSAPVCPVNFDRRRQRPGSYRGLRWICRAHKSSLHRASSHDLVYLKSRHPRTWSTIMFPA